VAAFFQLNDKGVRTFVFDAYHGNDGCQHSRPQDEGLAAVDMTSVSIMPQGSSE
jgi:hypothetical protein